MRYEFIVRDRVLADVEAELPEFYSTPFPTGGTALCAPTIDQSDLLSLVARLEYLGLAVIEMRHLPD